LILLPTTTLATEPVVKTAETRPAIDLSQPLRLQLSFNYYSDKPDDGFLDAVTMASLPPGSLKIRFTGFHGFVVKHIRSQYRRFVRHAFREGWYVLPDKALSRREVYQRVDHTDFNPLTNGAWWQRSWNESLPPEKGGAPLAPHIHTYGQETAWKFGPITVTNTFKVKFDYVAFFELNPDPVSHEHSERNSPVSLDVRALQSASFGTRFRFGIKPHVRLGVPRNGDLMSFLRGASIRGTFDIQRRGRRLLAGEVEVKWRPRDGVVVTLEFALLSW
jgi:hypothetical protein